MSFEQILGIVIVAGLVFIAITLLCAKPTSASAAIADLDAAVGADTGDVVKDADALVADAKADVSDVAGEL